ncbi:hypothetical protein K270103H11_24150 [Gordonibacter urolithinfaciens]
MQKLPHGAKTPRRPAARERKRPSCQPAACAQRHLVQKLPHSAETPRWPATYAQRSPYQ